MLDTSPYPTPEAAAEQELVLRRKDATAKFDHSFTSEISRLCDRVQITYRYKDEGIEDQNVDRPIPMSLGRTELGRMVAATGGDINGTTLQIPTTGYHTANETASLSSVSAALRLLGSYI